MHYNIEYRVIDMQIVRYNASKKKKHRENIHRLFYIQFLSFKDAKSGNRVKYYLKECMSNKNLETAENINGIALVFADHRPHQSMHNFHAFSFAWCPTFRYVELTI